MGLRGVDRGGVRGRDRGSGRDGGGSRDGDRGSGRVRGGDRDRGRGSFRKRDGGETSLSVAGRAADPAGALLAQYQNGPWSARGGGTHAHRALTTTVEVTSVFKVVASDGLANAYLGYSVVTNGSITVVGASDDRSSTGRQALLSHLILLILLYKRS
jgi:hypothetical protein